MMPDISVVICAYTSARWDALLEAVASIRRQTIRPREVIVIIDHNAELLARAAEALPDCRVAENRGRRGLSGARNTGIDLAEGEVIAFLDDDAEAAPDWLQRLMACYVSPEVVGVGGNVEPKWETHPPAWFPKEFYWVVGCSYRGLPEVRAPVRNLFGGCMCVRREALELVGGFRSSVGRSRGLPMGCEETELCIRVRQHRPGWQFIYEPRAWASHRVPAERTRWEYFRSRCYAEGMSKAQVSLLVGTADGLSSERAYTYRTLPRGILQGLLDLLLRRDLYGLLRSGAIVAGLGYTALGFIAGLLAMPRAKKETRLEAV